MKDASFLAVEYQQTLHRIAPIMKWTTLSLVCPLSWLVVASAAFFISPFSEKRRPLRARVSLATSTAHPNSSTESHTNSALDNPQALDILRDLDGSPLTNEYFSQKMGISGIESYICPETEAFRGFMSNGCRVYLLSDNNQQQVITTAFYKRIDFSDLKHSWDKFKSAPHKIQRDLNSYQVVAAFLHSQACHQLTTTTGIHIPKCFDVQSRPNHSNPMESKFTFLLEDLNQGWYQRWLLDDLTETEAVLSVYAKMHAFFWTGSKFWSNPDAAKEFEEAVWKSGSYVQPEAQGMDQWKTVKREWQSKRLKFANELSSFEYWDNLGERLQSVSEKCGFLAHPFADDALSKEYHKYRTYTHGDPKQANIFFRQSESGDDELEVGLIDFQWSGFGLAATDIAHFVTSAVHADLLVDGGEERLLHYYFDELQKYLVEYGVYKTSNEALANFGYDTFLEQYEIGVLDICRLVVAYTWARFVGPIEENDEEGKARTMNLTSYNKSLPNVIWLMSKCDELLKSRGVILSNS